MTGSQYLVIIVLLVSIVSVQSRSAWLFIQPERDRYNAFVNVSKTLLNEKYEVLMFSLTEWTNYNVNVWIAEDNIAVSHVKCGNYDPLAPVESTMRESYNCLANCLAKETDMPRACKSRTYEKPDIMIFDCNSYAMWDFAHQYEKK